MKKQDRLALFGISVELLNKSVVNDTSDLKRQNGKWFKQEKISFES
ncbi:MAG: hypothetical protein ACXVBK_08105 [Flavisolibacter sp.]